MCNQILDLFAKSGQPDSVLYLNLLRLLTQNEDCHREFCDCGVERSGVVANQRKDCTQPLMTAVERGTYEDKKYTVRRFHHLQQELDFLLSGFLGKGSWGAM